MQKRLYVGALAVALTALVYPLAIDRWGPVAPEDSRFEAEGERELEEVPPGLARKFAAMAQFSPGAATLVEEVAGGTGAQDWIEHSTPGLDIPYSAFAGARGDWLNLKARPADGGGAGRRSGPSTASRADNPFRDRSVYNSGTDNFSGRSIAAAIDPDCVAGDCRLWLANANGGVWLTRRRPGAGSRRGSSCPTRSSTTAWPNWRSIRTTPRRTPSGPGPASRTPAAAAARPASACTRPRMAASRGVADRDGAVRRTRGGVDRRPAGQRRRGFRGVGPRRAGRLEHLLRRRRRPHPRRAPLRALSLARRRRQLAAREPGRGHAVHGLDARSGGAQPDPVRAARGPSRHVRSGRPEHRLRVVLVARHLAVARSRESRGSRSCRSSAPRRAPPSARSSTSSALERRDADVRRRRRRRATSRGSAATTPSAPRRGRRGDERGST